MAAKCVIGFGLFVAMAAAHKIISLEVPRYADPRRAAHLMCVYDMENADPGLHSVKWYSGEQEIFKYMPRGLPATLTFNTTVSTVTHNDCTTNNCSIYVTLSPRYGTRVSYTCEISTEGPRFAVAKQTKNLTVAVTLEQDPVIIGAPRSVQAGQAVLLNCSAGPAMPPADIHWYIDGKEENIQFLKDSTEVSAADKQGLRMSWRSLRVTVDATTCAPAVAVRCEARQPVWPPHARSTNVSLAVARLPPLFVPKDSVPSTAQAAQALLAGAALLLLV